MKEEINPLVIESKEYMNKNFEAIKEEKPKIRVTKMSQ